MTDSYLCISIPSELLQYKKTVDILENENQTTNINNNFGVKILKDNDGNINCAAYYAENGELLKKIYYKGSVVNNIEHYRNNILKTNELYDSGKIRKKLHYDNSGRITSTIMYEYNRHEQITAIKKISDGKRYLVEYGYDELMRVNSRIIKIDSDVIAEQHYRYDILDRIIDYTDKNQTIHVNKINNNNELISYTIIDTIGNSIYIKNKYLYSEYLGTEIDLNGHCITVKDNSYIDNVMLKRPYTTEDDLDLTICNLTKSLMNNTDINITTRKSQSDIMDCIINENMTVKGPPVLSGGKILPISIRKSLLLQKT